MAKALYDGVGGVARKIIKKYVGVGGVARKVIKAYDGVGGIARQYWASETKLGELAVGETVYMNVNGVSKEFIVVQQGRPSTAYDSSCDGTWLLMKDCYEKRVWDSTNNDYANSDIHAYLNGTFLGLFDMSIQSSIKTVKIPYVYGGGKTGTVRTGASGLSTKIFLPSCEELNDSGFGGDGSVLEYFNVSGNDIRLAYYNGTIAKWWTRSPRKSYNDKSYAIISTGRSSSTTITESNGIRPCLIMPSDTTVDGEYNVIPPPLTLGALDAGETVYMNVNGVSTEFIVVQQGLPSSDYDSSCDGTWLLMKDCYTTCEWDASDNDYAYSDIHSYLNGTFINLFDSNIKSVIKQARLPYVNGTGVDGSLATGSSGISAKAFILTAPEIGFNSYYDDGAVLDYFEEYGVPFAYYNGSSCNWWLRTPEYEETLYVYSVTSGSTTGTTQSATSRNYIRGTLGVRPCVILPSTLGVDDSYNVVP